MLINYNPQRFNDKAPHPSSKPLKEARRGYIFRLGAKIFTHVGKRINSLLLSNEHNAIVDFDPSGPRRNRPDAASDIFLFFP